MHYMEFYKKGVFKNVTAYISQLKKFSNTTIEPEDNDINGNDNDDDDSINTDKEHINRLFFKKRLVKSHLFNKIFFLLFL